MTIVFLHVGKDLRAPTLLVRSLRRVAPAAEIIQCADPATPEVPGVNRVYRREGNLRNLMTFRLECFAELSLESPAAYIDTDMLMLRTVDPTEILAEGQAAVCARSFDRDAKFNASFMGMDLSEYRGMTLAAVYPYLACFTVARNHAFWDRCRDELERLPEKFHYWYGDQEAIRNVVDRQGFAAKTVPERTYACLPERIDTAGGGPYLLHFKGARRKGAMLQWAKRLGIAAS